MGLKQGLEVLVDAARLAPGIRVVIMGDGNQREALCERAAGLRNLDILPPAGADDFTDVLAAADVLAVTQRASVLDMSVPSKLTSYFVSGRPVVASVAEGEAPHRRSSGPAPGSSSPRRTPRPSCRPYASSSRRLAGADALGANGPQYVARHLSREAGLARFDALLTEVLADAQGRPRP